MDSDPFDSRYVSSAATVTSSSAEPRPITWNCPPTIVMTLGVWLVQVTAPVDEAVTTGRVVTSP